MSWYVQKDIASVFEDQWTSINDENNNNHNHNHNHDSNNKIMIMKNLLLTQSQENNTETTIIAFLEGFGWSYWSLCPGVACVLSSDMIFTLEKDTRSRVCKQANLGNTVYQDTGLKYIVIHWNIANWIGVSFVQDDFSWLSKWSWHASTKFAQQATSSFCSSTVREAATCIMGCSIHVFAVPTKVSWLQYWKDDTWPSILMVGCGQKCGGTPWQGAALVHQLRLCLKKYTIL